MPPDQDLLVKRGACVSCKSTATSLPIIGSASSRKGPGISFLAPRPYRA